MMDNRPSGKVQSDAPVEDQFGGRRHPGPQLASSRNAFGSIRPEVLDHALGSPLAGRSGGHLRLRRTRSRPPGYFGVMVRSANTYESP